MKFFTPELFLRFNSADEAVADRADDEWEAAVAGYRRHLDQLRDGMPDPVQQLAELCLHDAELLATDQPVESFLSIPLGQTSNWIGVSVLLIRQKDRIISLTYFLDDHVRRSEPPKTWPFSNRQIHWLYDELDAVPNLPGRFRQRVLWSDGSILEVPFVSVLIRIGTSQADASRLIA